MTTQATRPITREEKENSKKEFEDLMYLIHQELRGLEGWLLNTANKKLTEVSKLLTGDLKDANKRWQCEAEIRIVKSYTKSSQTKLNYVESLVGRLNEQVIRAPHKVSDADEDTSESRLYKARDIESKYEDSREAFDHWVSWCMQTQETFNNLTNVKTPKDEDTEEAEDRDRRRPRYEDKGLTTNAT